ncbi:lysophospholipid acyltransferase family protein [Maricaulis sp. CAU 1757]
MRVMLFNIAFWTSCALAVLAGYALSFLPGRGALIALMRGYCAVVRALMRWIMGIRLEVRGRVPRREAVIVAAKHQSWADGFMMMAVLGDINFLIGNDIEKFPLVGRIVRRAGATMINTQGQTRANGALDTALEAARDDPRPLLIYPEGGLAPVGETMRYRKGVHVLYETLGRSVVPVATNLGLRWPRNQWRKYPGPAVLDFLEPIPPGLPRDDFLPRLMRRIEARTRTLEAEGRAADVATAAASTPETPS